jgi:c-di-AMP phosphodiesterase-like protein
MTQALRNMRLRALIIISFELIVLGTGVLLWFYDFPNGFKDFMKTEYWMIAFGAVILINLIFLWISLLHLSHIRQKSDLEAATMIGADVQEAYNFGQIGLVVCDEHGTVLWDNNLFKERKIDLLDLNILDWQPDLRNLQDAPGDMTAKIEADGKIYQVKYLSEAHLYIFKDTTDYEKIFNYSQQQGIVLGIILLDNYNDIAGNAEDDTNDVVSKVRGAIFEYAKDNGVLLRRFRSDSYFAVCNYESLQKMQADQFSILAKVRALGKGSDTVPTLSVGFAHNFPDVNKLNEMASNAIDIAMSRGGDQAVVSKYGEELKFYGGKTEAVETTEKVKVRSIADSLVSLIRESTNVLTMGHADMDMDSLGSCLGIKAFCEWIKKPCQIIYDPKMTEKKTRYAFQGAFNKADFDRMVISPKDAVDKVKDGTLVIVCDISVPSITMAPKVLEKASKVIVIDHHRRGTEFIEKPVLAYIEPSASSASELIAEMLHYATANPRIEVKPAYATIMLSGIFLDTSFFKSKTTGMRTFDAAEILKSYSADNSLADDYLKDEYEEYSLITKIVATMKTPYFGIVYCLADENDIIERSTLAKVANQVMQLKGINACFVIGKTEEKEIRISARSDGTVNVQLLAEKMGGGGHFTSASALFKNQSIANVESTLIDVLDEHLTEARNAKPTDDDQGE